MAFPCHLGRGLSLSSTVCVCLYIVHICGNYYYTPLLRSQGKKKGKQVMLAHFYLSSGCLVSIFFCLSQRRRRRSSFSSLAPSVSIFIFETDTVPTDRHHHHQLVAHQRLPIVCLFIGYQNKNLSIVRLVAEITLSSVYRCIFGRAPTASSRSGHAERKIYDVVLFAR